MRLYAETGSKVSVNMRTHTHNTLIAAPLNESTNMVEMKEQYVEHIASHNVELMNIQGGDMLKMEHYIGAHMALQTLYSGGRCANLVKFCLTTYVWLALLIVKTKIQLKWYFIARNLSQRRVECLPNGAVNRVCATFKTTHEYILAVSSTGTRLPLELWSKWKRTRRPTFGGTVECLSSFCEYLLGKYWRARKRGVHKKWKAYFRDELLSGVCV